MKKLLVIGFVWPEPTTTAAGNRMLQLLQAFLSNDYQITFVSTAQKTAYSHDLERIGIRETPIQLNDSDFDALVSKLQPNVVLFDRFMVEEQFGWRVVENCPSALRILNTEDLHSLREYREKCIKGEMEYEYWEWLKQEKTKREIASIYRSDLTLLISSFEKTLLQDQVTVAPHLLWYLPFMLDTIDNNIQGEWPSFEQRTDFVSFGNGKHAPNVDSYRYLKETIWPLIRNELPKAKLHVYGAYLPQDITEMHNSKEGFLVHGWTKELGKEIKKAKVVLAPLRFGAGIKGKLAFAMQNGTPNITTTLGMEGMTTDNLWPGDIEDNPEIFAKKAIELYGDKRTWQKAQNRGVAIVNSNFNKASLTKAFFQQIEQLSQNLENHRHQNFIGSLLQHQTMAATKYMGKWIEEKNKRAKSQ